MVSRWQPQSPRLMARRPLFGSACSPAGTNWAAPVRSRSNPAWIPRSCHSPRTHPRQPLHILTQPADPLIARSHSSPAHEQSTADTLIPLRTPATSQHWCSSRQSAAIQTYGPAFASRTSIWAPQCHRCRLTSACRLQSGTS